MMPKIDSTPPHLKPYRFHGLDYVVRGDEAVADCPWCGGGRKFTVNVNTGLWRCLVCNAGAEKGKVTKGGNVYTFLRLLWERGVEDTGAGDLESLARERRLLPETLSSWGVVASPLTGDWLVPGHGPDGKLNQLYRYGLDRESGKRRLYATAELGHQLHGMPLYDAKKTRLYITEGCWDGMALWETMGAYRKDVQGYAPAAGIQTSLLREANVIAVPGCNVWRPEWGALCKGHKVALCFDSDHPRMMCRKCKKSHSIITHKVCPKCKETLQPPVILPPGYEGARRVAQALMAAPTERPESLNWLQWGPNGYDPSLPEGYDLRDALTTSGHGDTIPLTKRGVQLTSALNRVVRAPDAMWVQEGVSAAREAPSGLELLPCSKYDTLREACEEALYWTEGLDRGLSISLAVCLSTRAGGDQLWVTMISPASTGKSTLCEMISTAKRWVCPKSIVRGFHSGYKTDSDGKQDNSLIPLILDKTVVIKDGDTLLKSPNLPQILSELRDIYDRTSRASYRHGVHREYEGLNVTFIIAGTSAMDALDRSELGQRFLRVVLMDRIDHELEHQILMRKAMQADEDMNQESNGKAESQYRPSLAKAMQMTGGYVEYLRSNAKDLLAQVTLGERVRVRCAELGRFVAYMRARPSSLQKENAEREFATRLTSQFVRLHKSLCVVRQLPEDSPLVAHMVRQTALDTARGRVLRITKRLYQQGDKGAEARSVAVWCSESEKDVIELLTFMCQIGAAEMYKRQIAPKVEGEVRFKLPPHMMTLYHKVIDVEVPHAEGR